MQDSDSRYVIVKGSNGAGLGDKLRSLACAILVAKLTGRILHVDWCDGTYCESTENYFHQLFQLRNLPSVKDLPRIRTVRPKNWLGRLHCSLGEVVARDGHAEVWDMAFGVKEYSICLSRLDYQEDAIVVWDFFQLPKLLPYLEEYDPRWGHGNQDQIVSDVLREHLVPVAEITDRVHEVRRGEFDERFVIGVHVRHTHESASARTVPRLHQYTKAVRAALRQHPGASVFLATDNRDVEALFRRRFGASPVICSKKWLPPAGEPIHNNRSCPNALQSARESLVDVFLLAACDHLITLHNSSFSIVASLLSDAAPDQRTVLTGRRPFLNRVLRRLSGAVHLRT